MTSPRQLSIEGWNQERLESASVLIGGCGAIGSSSAIKLARMGVKIFYLVDPDVLEPHNIYNQEYTLGDIGKPKVKALEERLEAVNSAEVSTYQGKIEDCSEEFLEADIFLSCFDNIPSRYFMNYLAVSQGKSIIDAGIDSFSGTVRSTVPGNTFCMECHPSLVPEEEVSASCSIDSIPSTAITAAHASDIQLMQLLKVVFGWQVEPYIYFDLNHGRSSPIEMERNPDCQLCGGS